VNIAAAVSLLATAVGLVFGVVWWRVSRAPGWHHMRWFAVVALTAAGYCAFDTLIVFDLDPAIIRWATQMAFTLSALHAFAWVRWLADVVPRPLDRFDRIMLASSLLWAAAGFVPGLLVSSSPASFTVDAIGVTYRAFVPTGIGSIGYLFFLLTMWVVAGRSMVRWNQGWRGRMPAIAVALLTLLAINDALATAQLTQMPMLVDLGFLIVMFAFGVDSLRQFADDAERLEELKARLEQSVAERTRQLEVAHLELAKERTVAAVGRLAGGVAHQINSPATVLSINLGHLRDELVEDGQLTQTRVELLDESREALHRILGIVTDLRASAGAIETHGGLHHSAGLRACVEAAVERAAQRGARAAHTFVNVASDLHVLGDRDIVTQLLMELVANAVDAALAARGPQARLGISAQAVDGAVDVEIRDNGAGVPPAVRAALFEPFVGELGVAQRRGLGLAVVRGLAEQLGASLQLVESSEAGTTFRVRLRALPGNP
jgi:signal transduction histidine kinase